jgi:pimeloyl-ACP methyl ester carboxylesterase
MVLAGLIFAYVTLCVLYSKTQWQIVLHPLRQVTSTPAAVGLRFEEVHFGVDGSGEPQLDGWWIPAPISLEIPRTVLMLHGERGTMADALAMASLFHDQGMAVLLFDYRGYGKSGGRHPSQQLMQHDARSALKYLESVQGVRPVNLVVYGRDLGASLALDLCLNDNVVCPALVLDAPEGDLLNRALHAARSAVVPVRMLFHEDFPLAQPLASYMGPRLIILHNNNQPPAAFRNGRNGSMVLSVLPKDTESLRSGVQRFLADHEPKEGPKEEP